MDQVTIKTDEEIKVMAEGGRRLGQIRQKLAEAARPGTTTQELDRLAWKLIKEVGGKPSFAMVEGYNHATCINVNDVVVHGIPGKERLREGDKVGIDVGMYYQGWHTDTATTVTVVGRSQIPNPKVRKFLEVGKKALKAAIEEAKPGKRIMDVSETIEETIKEAGYSAVRALTGHGIGKSLHEEPAVPCFVIGEYQHSPEIVTGMVLAIEVMYNEGRSDVVYKNDDGWTIVTADGKMSALFEETVAVTAQGPKILTREV